MEQTLTFPGLLIEAAITRSPSIDLFGTYFPAWLISTVVGVLLAAVCRLLFIACKIDTHLLAAPLVYPGIAIVGALSVWFVLYQN